MRTGVGIALVLTSLALGCVHRPLQVVTDPPDDPPVGCLALLPFEDLTGGHAGATLSDLAATELLRTGRLQVLDAPEAQRILGARGIFVGPIADTDLARNLGQLLGVQAVLIGSIDEYAESGSGHSEKIAIGASFKLVDVRTGTVRWRERLGGAKPPVRPGEPMFAAAQDAAHGFASDLVKAVATASAPKGKCWAAKATAARLALRAPPMPPRPAPTPVIARATPTPPPALPLTATQQALFDRMRSGAHFVLDGIVFVTKQDVLDGASGAPLSDLATVLSRHPEVKLRIEDYLDPTDPGALDASKRRAVAVVGKLMQLGVGPAALEAAGLGGAKPLFPSIVEATRAKNRRVEVTVLSAPTVSPEAPAVPNAATIAVPAATEAARVKILAGAGTNAAAIKLVGALKATGTRIVAATVIPDPRPATQVYFRPGFEQQAQALIGTIGVPAPKFPSTSLGDGIDILVVVGSDLH